MKATTIYIIIFIAGCIMLSIPFIVKPADEYGKKVTNNVGLTGLAIVIICVVAGMAVGGAGSGGIAF